MAGIFQPEVSLSAAEQIEIEAIGEPMPREQQILLGVAKVLRDATK